jgi:hypothetical protein
MRRIVYLDAYPPATPHCPPPPNGCTPTTAPAPGRGYRYAGLDADGQDVAQGVDLVYSSSRVAAPAHDVQHGAKDFLLEISNGAHFKGLGRDQVGQRWIHGT